MKGIVMKKTFISPDITCQNCANLIKASLEDQYSSIEINLTASPKEVSVELDSKEQEESFKKEMQELGFNVLKK